MVMTHEQSNSPSGRVMLLPSKRVEADEVSLHEHFVCVLEQWGSSSEGAFSSVPAWESKVLHRSTKGFDGSCCEKMSKKRLTQDWLLHHDNVPCHTLSQLFRCLTKIRWWWYLASVLLLPSLHGLFWLSKIETWLIMKTELNCRQHWSALQNRSFRGVSNCGRDSG